MKGITVAAPTGNRTQGKCLQGMYVITTPSALNILVFTKLTSAYFNSNHAIKGPLAGWIATYSK